MRAVINIPIERLKPHPRNVRREIGDISELAESIRQQGIFQNLTVVKDPEEEAYFVVIGNRRLAAAKEAGITHLPCIVVEMDEKEQQATMLLENIQRTDLTPLEQAQGFQTCLDLGMSVQELEKKTGFSQKTIKHRLALNKLGDGLENTQFPLAALYELERVDDEKKRKEIFQKARSAEDLRYQIDLFLSKQRQDKNNALIKRLLEQEGVKETKQNFWKLDRIGSLPDIYKKVLSEKEVLTAIADARAAEELGERELLYCATYNGYALGAEPLPKEGSEDKSPQEIRRAKQREHYEKLKLHFEKMKENRSVLMDMFKKQKMTFPGSKVDALKIPLCTLLDSSAGFVFSPEDQHLPLLSLLILGAEHSLSLHCALWNGSYNADAGEDYKAFYEILSLINFLPTEEERMLIDGTHPDYYREEEEE